LTAIVVPRLMRIQDAAKYLSATTWQVETLLREKVIPSFVPGKRRVVDRLELDRYVERRNAMARTESAVPEKEEIIVSLVVAACVALFTECVEGTYELGVFPTVSSSD